MFGRERHPKEFKSTTPADQDAAIEAFRSRMAQSEESAIAHRDDDLQGLPPEVAEAKVHMRDEMARMAKEKPSSPHYSDRRYRSAYVPGKLAVSSAAVIVVTGLWLGGAKLTDASYGVDKAENYLEQQGYTDIHSPETHITFVGWRGCGESDLVQYDFETTAPNGDQDVKMMVCKGFLKAATSRQGE